MNEHVKGCSSAMTEVGTCECEIEVGLTKVANRKNIHFHSAHFDFTFLSRERSVGALVSCIGKLRSSPYDLKKMRSKNIFSSWRNFALTFL